MITSTQLIEEVKSLCDLDPDHIHQGPCRFIKSECNDACILGEALTNLGFSKEELSDYDYNAEDITDIISDNLIEITKPRHISMLKNIQLLNDSHFCRSEILKMILENEE